MAVSELFVYQGNCADMHEHFTANMKATSMTPPDMRAKESDHGIELKRLMVHCSLVSARTAPCQQVGSYQ